jgi:hypothetical protein
MFLKDFLRAANKNSENIEKSALKVTRASQEPNSLELYNLTAYKAIQNNMAVTHPLKSTVTHVLDFGLKKASDIVQCPHKIYACNNAVIQEPTGSWTESVAQASIDNIKIQDGTLYTGNTVTAGQYRQMLVEFDLSVIANQYGRDNATLKAKLKKLTVEAWASGSGANAGATAYGVQVRIWSNFVTSWVASTYNNTSAIAKISDLQTNPALINTSNKLYVLLNATYPSDGTIASTVNLDFIRLLVDVDTSAQADYTFIGGDTQTLTFDFGTKVADSVVECPMKIYRCFMSAVQPPTNITGNGGTGFAEYTTQAIIDVVKMQDTTNYQELSMTTVNAISQFMVEVDLTPLCNARFGGSNAALKAALKQIAVDCWARGSGASSGATAYGVRTSIFNANGNAWIANPGWNEITLNTSVQKITNLMTSPTFTVANAITTSNKLYFLIASQYASDGTIASAVDLDFIQVRVDIARTPDVVTPVPVVLPKCWSIIGEFSPNFDSNYAPSLAEGKMFINVGVGSDGKNRITFEYTSQKRLRVVTLKNNAVIADNYIYTPTFNKNQIYRCLIVVKNDLIKLYLLKNNGSLDVASTVPTQSFLTGLASICVGEYLNNSTYNADSFFRFIKLLKNWVPADDNIADYVLRGLQPPTQYNNLVTNGDFNQGLTNWFNGGGAAISVSANILNVIGDGTSGNVRADYRTPVTCGSSNKYYVRVLIRPKNSLSSLLQLYLYGLTSGGAAIKIINTPVQNQQYILSGITATTGWVGTFTIRLSHQYADAATANGKIAEVQQLQCIDLLLYLEQDMSLLTNGVMLIFHSLQVWEVFHYHYQVACQAVLIYRI